MRPFAFSFKSNVLHAQAYGTWLYLQLGEYGLFFGARMPRGLRVVWNRPRPRLSLVRHTR